MQRLGQLAQPLVQNFLFQRLDLLLPRRLNRLDLTVDFAVEVLAVAFFFCQLVWSCVGRYKRQQPALRLGADGIGLFDIQRLQPVVLVVSALEHRGETVVIALRQWIVFVAVAPRAFHCETHDG